MSRPQVKKLEVLRHDNLHLGEALDDLINAHDNTSSQLQNDPNGADIVPPQLSSLQVTTASATLPVSGGATVVVGGGAHLSIVDNSKIGRAVHYFVEYDTDPNFTNPWVEHFGPARNRMISLPNGTYFFKAYSQYPAGGPPQPASKHVYASGPIVISGSPFPALLPSQASGTGMPGTGGGHGAGRVIKRS